MARSETMPRVAVVVPCWNHGAFLPEAVASVRAQTYPNTECVVVDDGSTDPDTLRVFDDLRRQGIQVISQPNQGLAAARNTGVRATESEFFVPLDADDRIEPDFVESLLPPLIANPELGYCYCHVKLFGAESGVRECPPYDPGRLLARNLCNPTAVIRRAAFDRVGGYKSDMVYGFEDWDFWLALLAAGYRGELVPQPLLHYRKHATGSMLTRAMAKREEMVRTIIGHHRDLFVRHLGLSSADVCERPLASIDDELYERLQAHTELDFIENARSWRVMTALTGAARRQTRLEDSDPREELRRLKATRRYRAIRFVKRTVLYRLYAQRRYAPDELAPPT